MARFARRGIGARMFAKAAVCACGWGCTPNPLPDLSSLFCDYAMDICRKEKPENKWLTETHCVRCHLYNDGDDINHLKEKL